MTNSIVCSFIKKTTLAVFVLLLAFVCAPTGAHAAATVYENAQYKVSISAPVYGSAPIQAPVFTAGMGQAYAVVTIELKGNALNIPATFEIRGYDSGLTVADQIVIPSGQHTGSKQIPFVINGGGSAGTGGTGAGVPGGFTFGGFKIWPPTYLSSQVIDAQIKILNNVEQNGLLQHNADQNTILINEVDRHTQEFTPNVEEDALDFIELYNPNNSTVALSGYTIVLYEGLTNKVTDSFNLSGSIPAKGFYTIGSPAVPNANLIRSTGPQGKWLQAWTFGGTGIALFKNANASSFPVGAALPSATDSRFVDAIVNTATGGPSQPMINALTPGSLDARDGGASVIRTQSIGRRIDGAGTLRNSSYWAPLIPTPGVSNYGNDNLSVPARPAVKITVTAINSTNGAVFSANENAGTVAAKVTAEIVGSTWNVPVYVSLAPFNNQVVSVTDTITILPGQKTGSKNVSFTIKDNTIQEIGGSYYGYLVAQGYINGNNSRPFLSNRGWMKIIDNDAQNPIPPTPTVTPPQVSIKANNAKHVVVTAGDIVTISWSTGGISRVAGTYEPIKNYPIEYIGSNCPAKNNSTVLSTAQGTYNEQTSPYQNCTMKYVINGYNAQNQLVAQDYATVEIKPKNNPVAPPQLPSPTGTLTIGGTNGTYNTSAGATVRFAWSSINADNGYAKMEGTTVSCGLGYPKTTSIIMSSYGTYDMKIPAEYAGCTYKYTFYASHSNGKVGTAAAYLNIAAAPNPNNIVAPTAELLVNGQKDISIRTGEQITLSWTSTNASTYKGRQEGLDPDGYSCGSSQLQMASANSSMTFNAHPGYANCEFVYSVTMTNSAGQSVTSSVKVKYLPPLSSRVENSRYKYAASIGYGIDTLIQLIKGW